jgi:hypothetical protein
MSSAPVAANQAPVLTPPANTQVNASKGKSRRSRVKGLPANSANNSNLRNQGPSPGPATATNLSQNQTILKNDPMFGTDLFDETLSGFMPVSTSPTFTADAGPSFDIMDACYAALRAKDPNIAKSLPFHLFAYYWNLLVWHRTLYVVQHNQLRTDYWIMEFLEVMNSIELHVPKELALWLHGLGNTKDPNGDLMILDVSDVPSDAILNNKQGTFGQYSPATAQAYASLGSPYISAAYVQQGCNPDQQQVPQWNLGPGVHPDAINNGTDHRHLLTENLLTYYDRSVLSDRARSTLTDLGWRVDALPPDARGRFNLSVSTITYVSRRLSEITTKHPMTVIHGYTSPLGAQAQMPDLSVPSHPNDCLVQRATKRVVDHHSRYQAEQVLMSTSFYCAHRVERRTQADLHRSASYPIQIVDAAGNVQDQPPIPGWNAPFHQGDGATRMNHLYFRGSTTYRNDALVKISARIK